MNLIDNNFVGNNTKHKMNVLQSKIFESISRNNSTVCSMSYSFDNINIIESTKKLKRKLNSNLRFKRGINVEDSYKFQVDFSDDNAVAFVEFLGSEFMKNLAENVQQSENCDLHIVEEGYLSVAKFPKTKCMNHDAGLDLDSIMDGKTYDAYTGATNIIRKATEKELDKLFG